MNDIMVSVLCMVYNHEKYLRKCLDGLVSQKTDFKYEVIINEDCSSDSSAKIIREYADEYADIIKPIFQSENQYSKGTGIMTNILFPLAKGKYIAQCEGDDYWIDNNKLQKQFDYMEAHQKCSMCVHNTVVHDLSGRKKDKLFNNWKHPKKLSDYDVFFNWNVHSTSYFTKKECFAFSSKLGRYWFGDYIRLTCAYTMGDIGYLPDVMSVYNYNNDAGVTNKYKKTDINKKVELTLLRADYLNKLNKVCNYKYNDIIQKRIFDIEFDANMYRNAHTIIETSNKSEAISAAKKITTDSRYNNRLNSLSFVKKIKMQLKFNGYRMYPLWKYFWEKGVFHY